MGHFDLSSRDGVTSLRANTGEGKVSQERNEPVGISAAIIHGGGGISHFLMGTEGDRASGKFIHSNNPILGVRELKPIKVT